ncbi:type VI secretion system tip protein VgrG [Vibrio sp. ZSDZ65]|uniref:Type VI secretion system tip protein VgrG n=1 Tax=Vibrio qingdaonensis TaxID=2829491 RepID=A0A9X3CJG4_9VIBR|nr:type VI secretion system tip protein TssI/VgrG [Vibrio qingdaonensis]MCW8344577.1 type VI secretion system tip protein VgrG [Vibrio qingdaonensis]
MAEPYLASTSELTAKDYNSNEYLVSEATVHERFFEPYEITLVLYAKGLSATEQLGQTMTLNRYTFESGKQKLIRSFNGYVTNIINNGYDEGKQYASYTITLRPWLWLLTFTQNSRVFQNQSTKDIVSSIFSDAGFSSLYSANSLPSTKREYCIQYNESDYNFICRLLAQDGIQYYFEHSESSHKLILQDAEKPFSKAEIHQFDMASEPSGDYPLLQSWQSEHQFHSTSIELTNYDYSQSKLVSSKTSKATNTIANNTKLSLNQYGNDSITGDMTDLAALVKKRVEAMQSHYRQIIATSDIDAFFIGQYFSLESHADSAQLGDYLVVKQSIHYHSGNSGQGDCQSEVTVIPNTTPYLPSLIKKPSIHGLQSAIVAGSTAGDINQDEQGRVKILFQWDTQTSGDSTSCYVRVAQLMAGKGYGSQFIPRSGQEVLVSFINGDPDSPVITGSVYNSQHSPPYKEANATKSGVKTMLTGQSNEWYFDDKKDNELFYQHAAKDYTIDVENNHTTTVKGEVAYTATKQVTYTAQDAMTLNVTKTLCAKGKTVTIEGEDSLELKVGSSKITISSSAIKIESSAVDIKASNGLTLSGMTVDAKGSTSAKLSGASVTVDASGSGTIKGASLTLDAQTTLTAQAKLSADVKSNLKASINGAVMTEVKGAIVKVN